MKCIKCDSENTVASTGKELRKYHLLSWQCFDCDELWITGWDIGMPPRQDVIKHLIKYREQIEKYVETENEIITR